MSLTRHRQSSTLDKRMKELDYFLALEAELESSFNYIEPDEQNFRCYGAKYASLLNAICTEFESSSKSLIKSQDSSKTIGNIGDIKGHLLQLFPKIEENQVEVERMGLFLKPFEGWSDGKLGWWSSYTELKHNRIENYHEANLENLLIAMSALLVITVYLSRFRDKERSLRTCSVFWMEGMSQRLVTSGKKLPDE